MNASRKLALLLLAATVVALVAASASSDDVREKVVGALNLPRQMIHEGGLARILARASLQADSPGWPNEEMSYEIDSASNRVEADGDDLVVVLLGWDLGSCWVWDDEMAFTLTIHVKDYGSVPTAVPISVKGPTALVSNPDAQVWVEMGIGCFCFFEGAAERPPFDSIEGTVTFAELSPSKVRGSADLHLEGEIPEDFGKTVAIPDLGGSLRLKWPSFEAPWKLNPCYWVNP